MELEKLNKVFGVLKNMECGDIRMTLDLCRILMLIAVEPALTQKDIIKKLDIPVGNIARMVALLGNGTPKIHGFKLIKTQKSQYDWRSQEYFLSSKGNELIARIHNL